MVGQHRANEVVAGLGRLHGAASSYPVRWSRSLEYVIVVTRCYNCMHGIARTSSSSFSHYKIYTTRETIHGLERGTFVHTRAHTS